MPKITVDNYSDKAIIVHGDTQPYKDSIKEIGGKWNFTLKGWIFHKNKTPIVEELIKKIEEGKIKAVPVEQKTYEKAYEKVTQEKVVIDEKKFVPLKDYLDLLSRVERIEQIVSQVDFVKGTSKISKPKSKETEIIIESDEEEPKVERLLKRGGKK